MVCKPRIEFWDVSMQLMAPGCISVQHSRLRSHKKLRFFLSEVRPNSFAYFFFNGPALVLHLLVFNWFAPAKSGRAVGQPRKRAPMADVGCVHGPLGCEAGDQDQFSAKSFGMFKLIADDVVSSCYLCKNVLWEAKIFTLERWSWDSLRLADPTSSYFPEFRCQMDGANSANMWKPLDWIALLI